MVQCVGRQVFLLFNVWDFILNVPKSHLTTITHAATLGQGTYPSHNHHSRSYSWSRNLSISQPSLTQLLLVKELIHLTTITHAAPLGQGTYPSHNHHSRSYSWSRNLSKPHASLQTTNDNCLDNQFTANGNFDQTLQSHVKVLCTILG